MGVDAHPRHRQHRSGAGIDLRRARFIGEAIGVEAVGARDRVLGVGVRLDETKSGTGLGLAFSRDIAGLYGGTLDLGLTERASGLRATVRLLIPRA